MRLDAWARRRRLLLEAALVLAVALVPRLWGLGTFLTADEKNWVGRGVEFVRATREFRFNDTLQTTHPGIPTLWISGLTSAAVSRWTGVPFSFDEIHRFVAASQVPTAIINALLVVGVYLAARLVVPSSLALLAAAVIAFDPFLIAYSKVVHVDAFLTAFFAIALFLLLHAERTGSSRTLTLSALAASLAFLSKLPALILVPFAAIVLFSRREAGARTERTRRLRLLGQWLLVMAVTTVVLWPGLLWVPDPVGNVKIVKRDLAVAISTPHNMTDDYALQPWRYPATLLTRTTIPTFVGFVLFLLFLANATSASRKSTVDAPVGRPGPAGSVPSPAGRRGSERARFSAGGGESEDPSRSEESALGIPSVPSGGWAERKAGPSEVRGVGLRTLWLLVAFIALFILFMMIGAKKGDRYILPVFPIVDVLAVVGIWSALTWLRPAWTQRRRLLVGAGVLLVPLALELFRLGPYALAHFNPLFPPNLSQELGWGEGLDQVARFLNTVPDGGKVGVASWYPEELRALVDRPVLHLNSHEQLTIGYVVLYRNMFGRPPDHPANDFLDTYYRRQPPVFTATVNGLPYAWVYGKPAYINVLGELLPGTSVIAEFREAGDLAGVEAYLANYSGRATSGELVLSIEAADGKLLREASRPIRGIVDNSWVPFRFAPLESGVATVYAVLRTEGTGPEDAPTLRFAPHERDAPRYWVVSTPADPSAVRNPSGRGPAAAKQTSRPGLVGLRLIRPSGAP